MNALDYCLIIVALAAVGTAIALIWKNNRQTRQILESMDEMLDAAIAGTFQEMTFDESLLSRVEAKLAQYLSASEVSARNLADEKGKIKELIADISHQTKTPVANILLYSQLLMEQNLPESGGECVEALNTQARRLGFLIDSLVKASRLEAGILVLHPSPNPVQPMLDRVIEQSMPRAAEKNIELNAPPTLEAAHYDPKWTVEAVYNIIDNAVKYSPPGGKIHIMVTPYEMFCRLDLSDSGPGIAESEHARIFGRFYRCPQVYDQEGAGIGLYISRQILSQEGGFVKVESEPGQGSTFSVFLPRQG